MKEPLEDEEDIYLIPINSFISACRRNIFTDDDGYGYWATMFPMEQDTNIIVLPTEVVRGKQKPPSWATHVNWLNR